MPKDIVFTKKQDETPLELPDKELENALKENYDFKIAYVPEGYDVAILLISEDSQDSRKDLWKFLFYKKKRKLNSSTVTLDNEEELSENAEYEYSFYKEIDGSYEDVVEISADIIRKNLNREKKVEGE